jgi:hypothetical protein
MSNIVVANKYKLLTRRDGKYDPTGTKEMTQSGKGLKRSYVDERNLHDNNEWYEIDEEATKDLLKQREISLQENELKRKKESLGQADLIDVMAQMANTLKETRKTVKEEITDELDELGVEYDKRSSVKSLKELLNKNK